MLSQNSRQYAENTQRFSYTTYDVLGRVSEAGEKYENDAADLQMGSIFGSYVSVHFNPKVIDDDTLANWLAETSGLRTQVTKTYYDTINPDIATHLPATFDQANLRKRVVHVTYSDTLNVEDSVYNHATHYTYDIHGNVNTLVQDNPQRYSPGGAIASQRYKRLDYEYDLISGNVNEVAYEKDSADMMLHRYEYDGDNRIQTVETSIDNVVWDRDAKYIYYAHGPLARMELGENTVQGLDYAYTLQGWIKGVNSNTLDTTRDMGTDADTLAGNANAYFGKDVFGYTLNYFDGDYAPIDTSKWNTVTNRFEADKTGSDLLNGREDFFNGNISAMVTTITDTNGTALPQGMAYTYDQLNRILNARAWVNINMSTNTWGTGTSNHDRYYNAFTYDANGNILTQDRYDQSGNQIEDLTYQYAKNGAGDMIQNRLYHVNETINPASYTDDIDDQGAFSSTLSTINTANNYEYDGEGRLVRDSIEEIDTIKWTVTGKVKEVLRTSGSSKKSLKFDYDAMGQRIAKHIYDATGVWEKSTYYVRDPQGNVMTVYDQQVQAATMSYKLKERDVYGSSRVGMYTDTVEMIGATFDTTYMAHVLGMKTFELSNHLGNVLSTISDKVIPKDWNSDAVIDNYHADILSATDYYAFGVVMNLRNFNSSDYRYHFNGKETDDETGIQDYGMRMYNPLLARFMSVDPLERDYPWYTPYQFAGNKPVMAVDLDGEEEYIVTDFYDNVGGLYKTEITIVGPVASNSGTSQIVHRSMVQYNAAGSATVTYIGSTEGANAFANATEQGAATGNLPVNDPLTGTQTFYQPNLSGNGASFDVAKQQPGGVPVNSIAAGNSFTVYYAGVAQPTPAQQANMAYLPAGVNAVPTTQAGRTDPTTGLAAPMGSEVNPNNPNDPKPFMGNAGMGAAAQNIPNVSNIPTYGQAAPVGVFNVQVNSTSPAQAAVIAGTPIPPPILPAGPPATGDNQVKTANRNYMTNYVNNPR